MTKLFDGQGKEVEAFTQEEVDKLIAENPEVKKVQEDLTAAQTELSEAKKKIDQYEGSDKGQNMAALRTAKEAAEKKVEELTKGLVIGLEDVKKQLDDSKLDKSFITIAGGDEELAEKVKAEYNRIVK